MTEKNTRWLSYKTEAMFRALESGEKKFGMFTRAGVMGYIQEFIQSSYRLGSNPLRHLRRVFPQYVWTCTTLETIRSAKDFEDAIVGSDFSWQFDSSGECVTAKMLGRSRPLSRWFHTDKHYNPRLFAAITKRGVVVATDEFETSRWLKVIGVQFEDDICPQT